MHEAINKQVKHYYSSRGRIGIQSCNKQATLKSLFALPEIVESVGMDRRGSRSAGDHTDRRNRSRILKSSFSRPPLNRASNRRRGDQKNRTKKGRRRRSRRIQCKVVQISFRNVSRIIILTSAKHDI